jgi:ribosomal protein S12 methylthiotransferase accessory factor
VEITVDFPGGARVDAHFGGYVVRTDQPPGGGGEGSAPSPFALFLSSLGACAGFYVLGFCRQRHISVEGLRLVQSVETDPTTHMVTKVRLEIHLPHGFPEKYTAAIIRAAEQCSVKKHLEQPPTMEVVTRAAEGVHA